MMATRMETEPIPAARRSSAVRVWLAVTVPLGLVALAWGLWSISDRLGSIGPLDKAKFGWLVVIPIWVLTPVVAGYAWRRLSHAELRLSATLVGVLVAAFATALMWAAVAHPACEFGAVQTPAELLVSSLVVGFVIGGGLAGSALAALAMLRRARPWAALAVGAGSGFLLVFLAILAATPFFLGPACQRPPI